MSNISYYSKEGLNKMIEELHYLKTKGRAEMSKQIAEARDKGDLSENAEYDAAKDAQGLLELKISKLEALISNGRVINENSIDLSSASIFTSVKIRNVATKMELTYTLVSEEEANLKMNKISIKSPFGQGLLGKKVGELAEIKAPAGIVIFEILDISMA
ncbi:MAG TPA: transcription elongation factor GreA [Cytophagales bacterium]|nr:transcription elongation factor GreA [Cytophagales bacterium]